MGLIDAISGLVIPITTDLSGLKTGLAETDAALTQTDSKFQGFTATIENNKLAIIAVGAATTATGLAIVGLSESAMKTNAELGSTAITMGVTTEELRNLAIATASADSPLSEVVATFDLLSRAGVQSTSDLAAIAGSMDDLADATGNTADKTTSILIPALNAFSIPLIEVGQHTDSLTYMVKNSTLGLDDFSAAMRRMAPNIQASGMSMDEVITVLMTLESKGITGRAALAKLNEGFTAMETAAAAGTDKTTAFNTALGITEAELIKNDVSSEKLAGTTQKYAAVANAGIGATAGLKVEFEKLTLSAGTLLTPFDGLGVALAAGGPLIMELTQLPALIGSVNTAMLFLAANPIVLVIAAIAAIIVILVLLEEKFHWIEAAAQVLGDAWGVIWSGISWAVQEAADLIGPVVEALMDGIGWAFDTGIGTITALWEGFWDAATWVVEGAADVIGGIVQGLMDGIGWAFDNIISPIQSAWSGLWQGIENTVSGVADVIGGIVDGIMSGIKWALNIGIDAINGLINGINMISFDVPDWLGGGTIGFDIQNIPRLAEGGIVTQPTLAMVGESGPEAVVPLGRGGAGAGMGDVNLYFTGPITIDSKERVKELAVELQTLIIRTNRGRGIS